MDTDLVLDQFGIPLTNHMREKGLGFGEYVLPKINGDKEIIALPDTMGLNTVRLAKKFRTFEKSILKYRMYKSNLYRLPIYRETERDSDFFDINHSVKLHGNFQSWRIVEEASKYGFPKVFSLNERSAWVSKFLLSANLTNSLAIHFRLGQDAVDNREFSQPRTQYYLRAIEQLSFATRADDIYIFSDEIELARERFSPILGSKCNFVNPPTTESSAQKQFLLSQFGAIICANSTFCSWAGWSIANRGGQVVAPFPFSDSTKRGSRKFPASWKLLSKTSGHQLPNSDFSKGGLAEF